MKKQKQNVKKEPMKIDTIRRLFGYMLSYKKEIAMVLVYMTVIIAVTMINPILIKIVIDQHIVNRSYQGLLTILVIAAGLNLFSAWCMGRRIRIMGHIANKVLMEIRQQLYEHIQKLTFSFFDNRPVGKILVRIIGDVNALKGILTSAVINLIPDFITIITVAVIMLSMNYKLGLAALILLPMLVISMYLIEAKAHKKWQVFKKRQAAMYAFSHEVFSGIRVVQSFTGEKKTEQKFEGSLHGIRQSFIQAIAVSNMFWPLVELSWGIGTVVVFLVGVSLIDTSEVTVGLLVAFISYISMFWNPIMNLSNFYNQLITNMAGAERIFEILDTEPDIVDDNSKQMPPIQGRVEFENVTFSYDDKVNVLENLSFQVKPGETIALVGPTGAGKTTIINVLSRFYNLKAGVIRIDGQDISEVTVESLRSQMGIMTQDSFLFSGTIRDNIRYGKLDATDQEIEEAAKLVNAHDFIMELSQGYETKVNEKGMRLSVGQKQLIAFARTIVSNPKILILDEATSSIDTHTELLIQQGTKKLLEGRTSFVVAHRLSTIKNADRIMVIDNKGITEQGSHQQLIDGSGHYHDLYMAQFRNA